MNIAALNEIWPTIVCGLSFFAFFSLWRKFSPVWGTWFPALRKVGQVVIWSGLILTALFALGQLGSGQHASLTLHGVALALGLLGPAAILPKLLQAAEKPVERTERGALLAPAKEVAAMVKKSKQPYDISFGGVPLPVPAEPYHALVIGSTGAGKSVAIRGLLDTLRDRGDTVLLVDSGGEFCSYYHRAETDHIINPFDSRCAPWSPTAELQGPWDAEALARSIVPDGVGDNKDWNNYAQTFVASCIQALAEQGRNDLKSLLWAVQLATIPELKELLAGKPAQAQLQTEKTFGSIRTIATNFFSAYNYLDGEGQRPFSVSRFVQAGKPGFLFLTYRDDQLDSVRNLISCVLDIAARSILSLSPDPNRRIWLIIDEFASIGKVQSVEAVATKARKLGGCLVLGLQSIAQLRSRYGNDGAQSILSCLSTWLVLRCADAESAEYMSKYLGDAQVIRASGSKSSSEAGAGSHSWSEQKATERVVLASELQALPNLEGFLKLSGNFPVCDVKLAFPKKREQATLGFQQRDFNARPMVKLSTPTPAPATAPAGQIVNRLRPVQAAPVKPQPASQGLVLPSAGNLKQGAKAPGLKVDRDRLLKLAQTAKDRSLDR